MTELASADSPCADVASLVAEHTCRLQTTHVRVAQQQPMNVRPRKASGPCNDQLQTSENTDTSDSECLEDAPTSPRSTKTRPHKKISTRPSTRSTTGNGVGKV